MFQSYDILQEELQRVKTVSHLDVHLTKPTQDHVRKDRKRENILEKAFLYSADGRMRSADLKLSLISKHFFFP